MAQTAAAEQAEVALQERLLQQEEVYQRLQKDKRDLEHRLANMQVSIRVICIEGDVGIQGVWPSCKVLRGL
jgi:hypothetical protein